MQAAIESAWISYAEAQRLVGLGRTTIWRLVRDGEVRTAKVGRAVRLNRGDLLKAMMRRAEGGAGDGA